MRAQPYVSGGTHRVILSDDRALPPERASERSVFVVEPLSAGALYRLLDERNQTIRHPDGRVETIDRGFAQALDVVRLQLRSAENFPADAPTPYPASGSEAERTAYIAQLGVRGVYELGNAIMDQAFVGDAEKNS